ncbi:MAG: HIT family protein [Acidimicrobiales bacterium]
MAPLEQLWAGWRHEYVSAATAAERRGDGGDCVFCRIARSAGMSAENGIVWRGEACFAVLNAYPYASGHLLVVPERHVGDLDELSGAESAELWQGTTDAAEAVRRAYEPDGMNIGVNLGRAAGAGVPGHLHVHVLPRWSGDTNFMTSVGGVRVMPESLVQAWDKLTAGWPRSTGAAGEPERP